MMTLGRSPMHPLGHDSGLMIFMIRAGTPGPYHAAVSGPLTSSLYPPPRVLRTRSLPVSGGHVLNVQESGTDRGMPALVLHGGPGSGCSPLLTRFFDPGRWRVICVDQRGAGASRPAGSIEENTLPHLLDDLRLLRAELGIARWLVVGGSWGATLALLHAVDAPQAIAGLLLRSVFLARPGDVRAFFALDTEAGREAWQDLVDSRCDGSLIDGLAEVFETGTMAEQRALALRWSQWERCRAGLAPEVPPEGQVLDALVRRYRIQSHYLRHGCWLGERPLLERCVAVPRVPTLLLHGTRDEVCLVSGAMALRERMPHAVLRPVAGAGHDPAHPAMAAAMVRALDHFAACGRWDEPALSATGTGEP